jgi:hypothetical protein
VPRGSGQSIFSLTVQAAMARLFERMIHTL